MTVFVCFSGRLRTAYPQFVSEDRMERFLRSVRYSSEENGRIISLSEENDFMQCFSS